MIETEPKDAAVFEFGPVTFEITALGKPAPSFQWQHKANGSDTWIDLTDNATFSGSLTPRLTVNEVTQSMSGDQFRCNASNTEATIFSSAAILEVYKLPRPELKPISNRQPIPLQFGPIRSGLHYRIHHSSNLAAWTGRDLTAEEVEAGVVEIEPMDYPPITFFRLGLQGNGMRVGVVLSDIGLLAHYPFDGNVEDATGRGNNGILNGPTETEGRFGNPGSAYLFDGVDDSINIGNRVKPSFPISLSVWVKWDSGDGFIFTNDILDGNAFRHGIALQLIDGIPLARSFSGFSAPWTRYSLQPSGFSGLVPGEWTHIITIMHNYNDVDWIINAEFYAGEKFGTGTGNTMTYSANGNGTIGAALPAGFHFKGALDEIRIYDRALSTDQSD